MTDRIGIIGAPDSILAFKAIGVETFGASTANEAKELIKEMTHKNFKVIFITERLASEIDDFLKKQKSETYPCIIPIPSGEATGYGMQGVRKDMERAIGADILFRKD